MRYHSAIFSAKMAIPFLAIAYEDKTLGFCEKLNYSEFCLRIEDLTSDALIAKFKKLENEYNNIKQNLEACRKDIKKEAKRTLDIFLSNIPN